MRMYYGPFPEYPKIQGVYKRDEKGQFIIADWSTEELSYLKDNLFHWTEKIDGTNIRIGIDPCLEEVATGVPEPYEEPHIRIGGRTERAQLPTPLIAELQRLFSPDLYDAIQHTLTGPVVLYGEGYGAGIQKGGELYGDSQRFILFDVWVPRNSFTDSGTWLSREDVRGIAAGLNLDVVPDARLSDPAFYREHRSDYEGGPVATLQSAIAEVRYRHVRSSYSDTIPPEGLVGRPIVPLFDRRGRRIIAKVKDCDFKFDRDKPSYGGYL